MLECNVILQFLFDNEDCSAQILIRLRPAASHNYFQPV